MNPYELEAPSCISFSGGRTSAFMLRQIMDAHGGELPEDVIPVFCNTGLEHPATLDFIHEIEQRWTPVVWLEYRVPEEGGFAVVDYHSAARKGEPFTALIRRKNYLPNPVQRICTSNLKIRTNQKYLKSLGWETWDNAVGLRADEPHRVHRMKGDIKAENPICPMYRAGHTMDDVLAFWREQSFDLELPWKNKGPGNYFGNCVGCFLKGRRKLYDLMKAEPEHFDWWRRAERLIENPAAEQHGSFRSDRPPYEVMFQEAQRQGLLFAPDEEGDLMPCMCTD